jgi:ribosomal protein S18 acetylase RimI-like enzyme
VTPAPDETQLELHHRLLEALDHDPYVRFELDPGTLDAVATSPGRGVAWIGRHRSGLRWATGLAQDPTDAEHLESTAALLAALAGPTLGTETGIRGVTISRGGRRHLPDSLRVPEPWEWDFWWTEREPHPEAMATAYAGSARVSDLASDDPRVGLLLDLASPSAPLRPGDPRVVRWAGVEDPEGGLPDTGGLAAVLAVTRPRSGADHLNDVATHPDRRGRALARLLCGQVTADALRAGRPAVTLGMYADNDAARRVYSRLGFTCVRGQTSGPLHSRGTDPPH